MKEAVRSVSATPGMLFPEGGHRRGEYRLHPHRRGCDPEASDAAGDRRLELLPSSLHLAQHTARQVDSRGAQRCQPYPGGETLEQPAAELPFELCNGPGECRLGDVQGLGRGDEFARLSDRDEFHHVVAPVEHVGAPVSGVWCGLAAYPSPFIWAFRRAFRCAAHAWRGCGIRGFAGSALWYRQSSAPLGSNVVWVWIFPKTAFSFPFPGR